MMSAVAVRTGLPGTSLRVLRRTLAGTKSRVEPLESELIQRVLGGQHEAFRELVRPCERAVFMATQAILTDKRPIQRMRPRRRFSRHLPILPSFVATRNLAPGWCVSPLTKPS